MTYFLKFMPMCIAIWIVGGVVGSSLAEETFIYNFRYRAVFKTLA